MSHTGDGDVEVLNVTMTPDPAVRGGVFTFNLPARTRKNPSISSPESLTMKRVMFLSVLWYIRNGAYPTVIRRVLCFWQVILVASRSSWL